MLSGVRVLDLSRLLPGPACTWHLAGMGALVDRVETPGMGDLTRHVPPFVGGSGAYFAATSRGKRSLAMDLRRPEATSAIRKMLGGYDVLVEGFKPGTLEAMGLDPRVLLEQHPRLVIVRLSGYGQTGPWADRPGHDVNYVGVTGILTAAAPSGDAFAPLPLQLADLGGAQIAALGACAALFARERTGKGRVLDISLTEAALATAMVAVPAASVAGDPVPGGDLLTGGVPIYGIYQCADGRYITVGAVEPKFQAAVSAGLGAPTSRPDMIEAFRRLPRDEWVERLADACTGPALRFSEVADFPVFRDRGAVVRLAGASWVRPPFGTDILGDPPRLGEHSDVVLREAGIDPDPLRAAGVIA